MDASDAASRVDASLQGISLTRASDTLAPRDVQRIPLAGVAAVQTQASWAGSLDNLVARVRLVVASPRALDRLHGMIPVSGVVQVDYEGPRNMISFGQSYLQTTSTKLNIAGTLSSRRSGNSHVSVLVTTTDLHEVSEFATIVENALSRGLSHPLPSLAGSASLHAAIAGTAKNPVIRGQLAARDFEVDGSRWKALAVNLSAQPSEVSLQNGTLLANPRGEITFAGMLGLHDRACNKQSVLLSCHRREYFYRRRREGRRATLSGHGNSLGHGFSGGDESKPRGERNGHAHPCFRLERSDRQSDD